MLTRTLRKSLQREEGQALVLACLTVLVLSIAVITTVNIGHTVHEKIRTQNNADAAAYSMAAIEARAFNFYAFANRTQASHYVGAMTWQSTLSFLFFIEAFLTDLMGMLRTLNPCGGKTKNDFWIVACPILEALPYVGPVIKAVNKAFQAVQQFVKGIQQVFQSAVHPADNFIGKRIIPLHRVLNGAMYAASMGMMGSAASHVATASTNIINANDANADPSWGVALTGVLSACMFTRIHYRESMKVNPMDTLDVRALAENNKTARAKRTMGAVTNATRYHCDNGKWSCIDKLNTHRSLAEMLPLPDAAQTVADLVLGLIPKYGQTRFLSSLQGNNVRKIGKSYNYIRDSHSANSFPIGPLAQGDHLASDDIYWINIGFDPPPPFGNPLACGKNDDYDKCWGDNRTASASGQRSKLYRQMKTSIWALNETENTEGNGGVHWRLAYSNGPRGRGHKSPSAKGTDKQMGLNKHKEAVVGYVGKVFGKEVCFGVCVDKFTANVRPIEDGNHPWSGLAPFMHFEPGQFSGACPAISPSDRNAATREEEFNQPSTWVALSKDAAGMRNETDDGTGATRNTPAILNDEGKIKVQISDSGGGQELQLENKKTALFVEGISVISRGQTYYHRPGNWAEQPNFFNPYWRPRLASVYQGRDTLPLIGQVVNALPGPVQGFPQKIITH